MGIEVEWRDERGKVLGQITDSASLLRAALADAPSQSTQYLRYIDPYGDTTFNQLQLPALIAEFNALVEACTGEAAIHLRSVGALLVSACGQVHTYVTFVGD